MSHIILICNVDDDDVIVYNAKDAEIDGVYADISASNIAAAFRRRHDHREVFDGYRYLTVRDYITAEIGHLRGLRGRIAAFHNGQTFIYREDGIWKKVTA